MFTIRTIAMTAPIAMLATAVHADPGSDGYNHMMWGTGFGMFGGLMMLVFWGVVIALIVLAVRWLSDNGRGANGGTNGSNARNILEERFASGEIDEDEYRKRKAILSE